MHHLVHGLKRVKLTNFPSTKASSTPTVPSPRRQLKEFGRRGPALDKLLDALAVRRTCQILNVDTTQQNPDDAHPLFDRTKRPLLDHWRRNISFVLAKENVACFMHGVNNARNGQFQCDDQAQAEATESVHHVDLNYETSRMNF